MKKPDLILIIILLIISFIGFVVYFNITSDKGNVVVVKQNNKIVAEAPLYENKTITLDTNVIKIENGTVKMDSATCKNHICVNHAPISKKGETIICLPNKVYIEIKKR